MIQLANSKTEQEVRRMWKICFDDSDEFMDLYFSEKYQNENTLIYFDKNQAVASLQMLPYSFTFCGKEIPVSYISGVCTLPEYRNRGFANKLLFKAFCLMRERDIPISILIPAEAWLYSYYARYCYETVFSSDKYEIPLLKIVQESNDNLDVAYRVFDKLFRKRDFCVQKTKSDFITIIKDAEMDDFPPKTNLSGMARIIDVRKLLAIFAQKYSHKNFSFQLADKYLPQNNGIYEIKNGHFQRIEKVQNETFLLNENLLCRLLFGFRLEELPNELTKHFESHQPIMNLMLE
jgi:predicted acetyltransferase